MSGQGSTIRIFTQNNRICIHRNTLNAMGNPLFIHLGFHAESKELLLLGTWIDDRKSIRVTRSGEGSFYVNSKDLIRGIQKAGNILLEEGSYLVHGVKIEGHPIIAFPLTQAEFIASNQNGELVQKKEMPL